MYWTDKNQTHLFRSETWQWCLPRGQWFLWFLITIRIFVWTIITGWKILSCSIRKITTFCSFSHPLGESRWFPAQHWFSFCRCSMGILFHETIRETGQAFIVAVKCFQLFSQETFGTHKSQNWGPMPLHIPTSWPRQFMLFFSDPKETFPDSRWQLSSHRTCRGSSFCRRTPSPGKPVLANPQKLYWNVNTFLVLNCKQRSAELSVPLASKGYFKTWVFYSYPALMRTGGW